MLLAIDQEVRLLIKLATRCYETYGPGKFEIKPTFMAPAPLTMNGDCLADILTNVRIAKSYLKAIAAEELETDYTANRPPELQQLQP